VGLPLEVDKPNLMRGEYVRVLIGCRDITKIPASVEGVIDQHFYDFIFQREVPQEGITNSSGTKWVRTDRPSGDNPSPKKHKIGDRVNNEDEVKESQDQGDTSGSDHDRKHRSHKTVVTEDTHSLEGLDSAGRQPMPLQADGSRDNCPVERSPIRMDKGKKKVEEWVENNSQDGVSGEESDNPYFDDILSPGGQHINFGTFENLEIKKLWSFQIQDNATAA